MTNDTLQAIIAELREQTGPDWFESRVNKWADRLAALGSAEPVKCDQCSSTTYHAWNCSNAGEIVTITQVALSALKARLHSKTQLAEGLLKRLDERANIAHPDTRGADAARWKYFLEIAAQDYPAAERAEIQRKITSELDQQRAIKAGGGT